jgi:HD-GYP domain-containing protein (c-di-GMP phosphodiesterase class II)
MNLDEIITCLGRIARIFHEQPEEALKDLHIISSMIDSQVPYRDGHMKRVSEYSLRIGSKIGLATRDLVTVEAAALLHDFGKIGIDEDLLMKTGSLSECEREEIQTHALRGYYMLQGFAELSDAIEGVKSHHENYNGSGYPEGLREDNIPLIGRIIAIADAFDAMTSPRPYRRAKSKEEAMRELRANAGQQFDPFLVSVFIGILAEGHNTGK